MTHSIDTKEAPCGLVIEVEYMARHTASCTWCHRRVINPNTSSRNPDKPKADSLEALKAMFRSSK